MTGPERAQQRADDLGKLRPDITVEQPVRATAPTTRPPILVAAGWAVAARRRTAASLRS